MIRNKTTFVAFSVLILSVFMLNGCSLLDSGGDKKPPLEGERISVLELQKTLVADEASGKGQVFSLPDPWPNDSWPQAGGYPNHSMQNLSLSNDSLKRAWSADIGSGGSGDIPLTATPVVAGGVIYTLDTQAQLSAFSVQTGKRLWKSDVQHKNEDEAVIAGGIAFAHGMLYVTNGYDEVLALSPKNGDIKWRKRLPAPSRAAPAVINGRVFVSTVDSRLIALSAKDGVSLWEYTGIGETTGLLGAASPAVNHDIVVPVFSSGEITALRVENGSVAWSDNLSNVRRFGGGLEGISDIKAMPVLDRGLVVAMSFGGKLAAIDEGSGTRIWQREIGGSQTPWVAGSHVYVLSSENQLIALSLADGSIRWVQELARFENEKKMEKPIYWSGPVMASGKLIMAGSHGYILQVDAHNGDIVQKMKVRKNIQVSPIVAQDTLYALSEDGTLMAYR